MRKVLIAFTMLVVLGACLPAANAQDVLGGAALGVGLDKFASKIQESIQTAIGGGLVLEVGAGGQISILISQARTAYESDLNLTYSKLNSAEQQTVNSIASLVDAYEKKTYHDVADLEGRALAISHSLPFSRTTPRLFSYSPEYAVQSTGAATIAVRLDGDFTDIVQKGLDSTLTIKEKSFKNSAKSNGFLTFDVPYESFDKASNKVSYTMIDVTVPYKETCYIFFSCSRQAEFKVPVAMLPQSAGTVTVKYVTTQPGMDTRSFTCPEQIQESQDDDIKCGGEHGDLAVHRCTPDAGYAVDPNTVSYRMNWSQGQQGRGGDWWLESNCSSATTACLCFSTEHHRFGTSGKIHFNITFVESKPITTDKSDQSQLSLGWQDNKIVELPLGARWTGTYTRFDGKVVNFAGPFQDPYLAAYQNANVISFRTIP